MTGMPRGIVEALIVDDDEAVRRILGRMLEERGWSVSRAADGKEVLELPETGRFALAFLDVDLGGEPDGVALAQELRNLHPRMRIVMMSGNLDNAARVCGAGLGAILEKPFDQAAVEQMLEAGPRA